MDKITEIFWQSYDLVSPLTGMVKSILGEYKLVYHPEGPDGEAWTADFTPPSKRLDMMKELEKELGVKLPAADQLHTAGQFFIHATLPNLVTALNTWCADFKTSVKILNFN